MKRKATIGKAELEVLRFIAEAGQSTVTEVGDHLAKTKGQTRNTALNMMERLRKKGFLVREKLDGVFRYAPAEGKTKLYESLVDDFVDTVFGGSVSPLMAYLTRKMDLADSQIAELERIVGELPEGTDA